jgi:crotonyl-CoA reductase
MDGKVVPPLSAVFPLVETGEAAFEVHHNRHEGKIGVLCVAEREGLGITNPELRASVGEYRLTVFRRHD